MTTWTLDLLEPEESVEDRELAKETAEILKAYQAEMQNAIESLQEPDPSIDTGPE